MFLDDTIPLNESSEAIVKVSDTDTVLFTGDISVVDLNILGTDEIGMTGGSLNSSLSLMVDGSIDTATGENEAHEFPDHDHPDTSLSSANTVGDKTKKKQTVHSNPDWLSHLTDNFRVVIISKCSQRVRDAVETDENIQVNIPIAEHLLLSQSFSESARVERGLRPYFEKFDKSSRKSIWRC